MLSPSTRLNAWTTCHASVSARTRGATLRRMPAQSAVVYQTLVLVPLIPARARYSDRLSYGLIRRCDQYLRLMDLAPRVWSHALEGEGKGSRSSRPPSD